MHNLELLNFVAFGFVFGLVTGLAIHLIARGLISLLKSVMSYF